MSVRFPFSKLCCVNVGEEARPVLLASTAHAIQSIDLTSGQSISQWPLDDGDESDEDEAVEDQPRHKRLKLDTDASTSLARQDSELSEGSIEIATEGRQRQKGERRRPKIPDMTLPNVTHLLPTSDGKHVVVVTSEDKAVRVLKVTQHGVLKQVSSRSLPKRLCAAALDKEETTILTADKFGDVYAIPLHLSLDWQPKQPETPQDPGYKPAATTLTVHTKGNREALRQQELGKHQPKKTKECLQFEHKLIIGHVSLLTDLVVATAEVAGKQRSFILTSDRDEHIRVSRGIPQAHIIEQYCLGHREFVSRLCILPWNQNVLVSGSGEPKLRVYDWLHGQQKSEVDLAEVIAPHVSTLQSASERQLSHLAVSLLCPVNLINTNLLFAVLEGLPFVMIFATRSYDLSLLTILETSGNVLDIAQIPSTSRICISVDNSHVPGSMKLSQTVTKSVKPIHIYEVKQEVHNLSLSVTEMEEQLDLVQVEKDSTRTPKDHANGHMAADKPVESTYSSLGEFLYGLENLRKRRGQAAEEDEEADQEE